MLYVLFLLMAGTVVLYAQGPLVRISGNVKDEKGNILSYATIRLKDTSTGCITDYNGNFSFNGHVEGQTLIVSCMGYQNCEILLSGKTTFPLSIILKETSYQIDEVVIKPQKEKYTKKGNPAVELATEIINRKDAMKYAIEHGEPGDIIICAGKGHETYQEIMGVKRPFDEKTVVRELPEEMQ